MVLMERLQRQDASLIGLGFGCQERKQLLESYVAANYPVDGGALAKPAPGSAANVCQPEL